MSHIVELPFIKITEPPMVLPCSPKCTHCQLKDITNLLAKLVDQTPPYHSGPQPVVLEQPKTATTTSVADPPQAPFSASADVKVSGK